MNWDNGVNNAYRYGYENCYDVVEVNPMQKDSYVPLGGFLDCAESWARSGE